MKKAVEEKRIKTFYNKMVNDALTNLDLEEDWECRPYPITTCYRLSCDDGTQQKVQLVAGDWEGKLAVLLWSFMGGKYVEFFIGYPGEGWGDLWSDDVVERAHAIIEGIVTGGQEALEKMINVEGIENIHSLVLTEKCMKKPIRLPYSCAISFYGEVIAGVEEIKEYCKNQTESSYPYILKRCHDITIEEGETGESETVRCTNYLICKDAETAKAWMKKFVWMDNLECECILNSCNCPPMICYVEGKRYMLLSYKGGNQE